MKRTLCLLLCLLLAACSACLAEKETLTLMTDAGEDVSLEGVTEADWELWETLEADIDVDAWLENYEPIYRGDPWFFLWQLPADVICISELFHEQCGCAFLIEGEDRALLLDTGTGIGDMRATVEGLTDKPVTVLNSHDHFDHMSGNASFDEIWCYDDPDAVAHLTHGPTAVELDEILGEQKSCRAVAEFFGTVYPETVAGKAPTGTVVDGQIIDLGGRQLEVIHTPGHQRSCIMLLDRENKLLFTGDMFYPGPMYCFFDDSSFPDYVSSIRKAADIVGEAGVETLYTSHNLPTAAPERLYAFADFLEGIQSGEITDCEIEDGIRVYWMDEEISFEMLDDGADPVRGYSGLSLDAEPAA